MMNAAEAAEANVPTGYSDHVLELKNSTSGVGVAIDLSKLANKAVKLSEVESVVFRVCVPSNVYSIRATVKSTNGWLKTEDPSAYDQWIDFELPLTDALAYEDGETISIFGLAFRMTNNVETTVYVDSVTVTFKEKETTEAETETETETVDPDALKEEIPFCDAAGGLTGYSNTQTTLMNSTLAASSGVPEGYEGYVMSLCSGASSSNSSVCIDLRQTVCNGIKIRDVESITFRVYADEDTTGIRIKTIGDGNWQVNTPPTAKGQWIDFEVTDMSIFVDDGDGYFSPFVFAFRATDGTTNNTSYIDSITVKLKDVEDETTGEETTAAPELEKPYYTFEEGMGKDEIPYGATASVGTYYGYSSFMMMDETQAIAASVPEGYSGWVLALGASGSGLSVGLDLTDIHTMDIERISFRLWCPTGTKQDEGSGGIRISGNTSSAWNMLEAPTALNEWIDVVLEKDDFSSFDFDGDGYCDLTNFCLRGATGTAYIDHITVELRDPDTEPPVITYNGETVIETREGREFVLDISAHDAYYDVDIELEYIWSEGAIVDGELVSGTHTCTVRATDEAGNYDEIVLTVNVGERDTEAPSVSQLPAEMYAMAGAQMVLDVSVSDNVDDVEAVFTWSEGALDEGGRLCAGDHKLTVTATDLSGNESEQVITVHVLETRPIVGDLVQDS